MSSPLTLRTVLLNVQRTSRKPTRSLFFSLVVVCSNEYQSKSNWTEIEWCALDTWCETDNVEHYQIDRNAQINGRSYIVIYTCNRIAISLLSLKSERYGIFLYARIVAHTNYNGASITGTSICENLSSSKLRSIQKQILFTLKRTRSILSNAWHSGWVTMQVISNPDGFGSMAVSHSQSHSHSLSLSLHPSSVSMSVCAHAQQQQ